MHRSHSARFRSLLIVSCLLGTFSLEQRTHAQGKSKTIALPDEICSGLPDPPGKANGIAKHCQDGGSSSGVAKGDFNGDGFADLAVGVPDEDLGGTADAGAVNVIYGSPNGLTATSTSVPAPRFFSLDVSGIPGLSHSSDRFGAAVASGDFNGDGYSDLAIGIPERQVITTGLFGIQTTHYHAGGVVIIYGSSNGLTTTDPSVPAPQYFDVNSIPNVTNFLTVDGAHFGASLTWGDFNHDGKGDLAIGMPNASLTGFLTSHTNNGAVWILYGTSLGLRLGGNQLLTSNSLPIPTLDNALLGTAMTAADFNGDGFSELVFSAVGSPGGLFVNNSCTSNCAAGAGVVYVMRGGSGGLTTTGFQTWSQDSTGVGLSTYGVYASEKGDHFGASLAVGDFNGDGHPDLAIGTPLKDLFCNHLLDDCPNTEVLSLEIHADSGVVYVLYGSSSGLTANNANMISIYSVENEEPPSGGDRFGFALAAGDFNNDDHADLAISAPFNQNFFGLGTVKIIYGSGTGLQIDETLDDPIYPLDYGVLNSGGFGLSLTAWNFGHDVGEEYVGINRFGQVNPPARIADLAIGMPHAPVGTVSDAGAVLVLYGTALYYRSFAPTFQIWSQNSPGMPCCSETGDHFGATVY